MPASEFKQVKGKKCGRVRHPKRQEIRLDDVLSSFLSSWRDDSLERNTKNRRETGGDGTDGTDRFPPSSRVWSVGALGWPWRRKRIAVPWSALGRERRRRRPANPSRPVEASTNQMIHSSARLISIRCRARSSDSMTASSPSPSQVLKWTIWKKRLINCIWIVHHSFFCKFSVLQSR